MKRILCLILSLVMLVSMLPAQVNAQTGEQSTVAGNATVQGSNAVGDLLSVDIQQEQTQQESVTGYNVTDLTVEGNVAYVTYSALEAASVVVGIYDEEGVTLLASGHIAVPAGNGKVDITIEGQMPQYFRAIAYVLDHQDYRPLCSAYETPLYTYEMQMLLHSTVDDYDEELVLNLDEDDTTNFAVYNENTVRIEEKAGVNTLISADPDSLTYIFENPDSTLCSLVYGDVLVYAYGEENLLFAKVSSVEMKDSRAYIYGVQLEMEDVFSHVKIEADGNTSQVEVDTATAHSTVSFDGFSEVGKPATRRRWEGDSSVKVEMNYTICDVSSKDDLTEFSLSVGVGLQIKIGLKYYIALRGTYVRFTTEVEAGVFMEATGKITKSFPLGKLVIPVFPGLNVGFEPEIQISFEGKIDWSTKYKQTVGFAYEDGGFKNLTTNPEIVYSCEAEITVFFGFDLKPNFNILSPNVAKIEASIPVGFELKAKTTGIANDLMHTYDQTYHGCVLCLDGEIYFKIGLSVKLEILDLDWLSCSVKIVEVKIPLVDFYYSFDKLQGGEGECPFKKYPVTVETVDSNGAPISSVAVTIADTDWLHGTNEQGLTQYYLEPGIYDFLATKGDMAGSARVEIKEPQKVIITLLITGTVTQGVTWTLDKAGNLTVSGSGAIPDYTAFSAAPWSSYADQIKNVYITDGITSVGNNAFTGCANLESAYIGAGVSKWNVQDWASCVKLRSFKISANNQSFYADSCGVIYSKDKTVLLKALLPLRADYVFPDSLTTIGAGALSGQIALATLTLPEGISSIEAKAFDGCTGLKLLTFTGHAPAIAEDAFAGVEAEVLYCVEKDGWTAEKLQNYGGTITWTGYESILGSGTCGTNLVWKLFDDGTLIISGTGAMNNYTSYGPWYSKCISITKIDVKPGVTTVGNYAFYGLSNVTQVSLPQGLTSVGNRAFYNCAKLEHIVLPEGLQTVGTYAFYGCAGMKRAQIPDSVTSLGTYAFYKCASLEQVTIPQGITDIPKYTFYGCKVLCDVQIPGNVASIGDCAFYNNDGLRTIVVPQSVTSIGASAFYDCDGVATIRIDAPTVQLGEKSFYGCTNVISIRFADSTEAATVIGTSAFAKCENLREVRFGSSVKEIGTYAFAACGSLTKLIWGGGIQTVAKYAFGENNAHISQVHISSLEDWLGVSFEHASANPLAAGAQLLLNGKLVDSLQIPATVSEIKSCAFYKYAYLKELSIADGVVSIGNYAFYNCAQLQSVDIPASVKTIDYFAFYHCAELQSVTIPTGVENIGTYAFYDCAAMSELTLSEGVESIGNFAFFGCHSLTSVSIPASVTTIGERAFGYCAALKGIWVDENNPNYISDADGVLFNKDKTVLITFPAGFEKYIKQENAATLDGYYKVPSTVEQISSHAFYMAKGLKDLNFESYYTLTSVGEYAFYACSNLRYVMPIPYSISTIGANAFYDCSALENIEIPEKVTVIQASTFENCTSLTSITIGPNVNEIKQYAFAGCTALKTVEFKGVAPTVYFHSGIVSHGAPFADVTATAYYPDHESWTESVMINCGSGMTWVMRGYAAFPSLSVDTWSVYEGVALADRFLAGINTKPTEAVMAPTEQKTVTFSGLDAGEEYILLVLQSTQETDLLTYDNLVYIWQTTADESGTATYTYCARDGVDTVYELICGGKKRDIAEATVTLPKLTENIGLQKFIPTVYLDGVQLREGNDYVLSGDVTFEGAGEYICFIRGVGDYEGTYICTYTVEENNGSVGLQYTISADGSYYIATGIGSCTDTDLVIPAEYNGLPVRAIGARAFYGCTEIQTVRLAEQVTEIAENAFGNCTDLTDVVIGFKLTNVGASAFAGCTALRNVYYMGNTADWSGITIATGNEPLLSANISCAYCLHKYVNDICRRCGHIKAEKGKTIVLTSDMDVREVCVPAGVKLDLNGHILQAKDFVAFGDVMDTAGTGIVTADNYAFTANTVPVYDIGYLPVYDTTESGYRFFLCDSKNLGIKKGTDSVTFGFALNFEDLFAYQVLSTTQDPRLEAIFHVSTDGTQIGTYAFDAQLIRAYALLQQEYPQLQAALQLRVDGVKHLEDESYMSVSANLKAGEKTQTYQMGGSSYFYELPVPENSYIVRYDANGGTGKMLRSFHSVGTASALRGNTFTKTGYTFGGWKMENSDVLYADGEKVTDLAPANTSVRLYAQWIPNTYRILYECRITENVSSAPSNWPEGTLCTFDQPVTLPQAPTLTGWTFGGWYWDTSCTDKLGDAGAVIEAANLTAEVNGYVTLYAKFTPNSYTVFYATNGADSGSTEPSEFVYDSYDFLRTNGYSKTGYHHVGWSRTPDGAVDFLPGAAVCNLSAQSDGTVVLYAVWAPNTYTVHYDGYGADGGSMEDSQHTYDVLAKAPSNGYTKTGYLHIGWALTPGGEIAFLTGMNMMNLTAVHGATVTLYSVWYPISYDVRYEGNGATSGVMANSSFWYDTPGTLSANVFTRIGHTFVGWATSPDGPVVYGNGATVLNLKAESAATLKLYAKWTANTYTIVYHGNGATGGSTASTTHTYGVSGNLRANGFTRPNYTFLGWSTNAGAQKPTYTNGQAINLLSSGTVNLYAVWVKTSATVGYYSRDIEVTSSGYEEWHLTGLDKAKLKANGYKTLNITMQVDGQRWNALSKKNEPFVEIYNSAGSKVITLSLSQYPKDWQSQYLTFSVSVDTLGDDGSIWVRFDTNNKKWQLGDVVLSITVS